MSNAIEELYAKGQSIWCDNISRSMIDSGELSRLIELGVVGVTSNPTIFMKAITGSNDYDARLISLLDRGEDLMALYEGLVIPDIADAADLLRPVYDRTEGVDGYVSLEVNPRLADDTTATIDEARRLHKALNRPNVLIKVPATEAGFPAIRQLISDGISVNVTLIFSLAAYEKVIRAYVDGITRFIESGGDPAGVASVASFFVSRIDTLVDQRLEQQRGAGASVDHLFGRAAVASARLAYARFEEVFGPSGEFARLTARGAQTQRPLWASTGTKNPAYSPTMYVDSLVGPQTVNTLPPRTIEATLAKGAETSCAKHPPGPSGIRSLTASVTVRDDLDAARALFGELGEFGVDIDAVTDKLRVDGVAAFVGSFDELLSKLAVKQRELSRVKT